MIDRHNAVLEAIESYDEEAKDSRHVAYVDMALGAVCSGFAVYSGVRGNDVAAGFNTFVATTLFGVMASNLVNSSRSNHMSNVLRGALVQHELLSTMGMNTPSRLDEILEA